MTETDEIRTQRLLLRAPIKADAELIAALIGVSDVALNLGRVPLPYRVSDALDWISMTAQVRADSKGYAFVIDLPGQGVIGAAGLRLLGEAFELGYWLGKPWWGAGYVTEAARALLDWAEREQDVTAFTSGHFVDNPASGRVLEKLGFEMVGVRDLFGLARGVESPAKRYVRGAPAEVSLAFGAHD